MGRKRTFLLLALAAVLGLSRVQAEESPPPLMDSCCNRPTGPPAVACYARASDNGHYIGYYVGGGSPCLGTGPCPEEGTWGWDYGGIFLLHRVVLCWYHGLCYQGGKGAYKVDGPPLPDVPGLLASPHH